GAGGQRVNDFNTLLGNGLTGAPGGEQIVSGGAFPSLAEMLRADEVRLLDDRYQALAYEFVHMCLYGRGKQFQKPFLTYLARAKGAPLSEALFQECFGRSLKKMQDELQAYAGFTDYRWSQIVARKGHALATPPEALLREATPAEIGRIKGQGLLLAGHRDAARVALITPYVRGEYDPELLAALGLFEIAAGKPERARKFLESAVAGHTAQPGAYLALARLRHAEQRRAFSGPLDDRQRETVLAPLRTATALPPLVGVYELMVEVWLQSAARPAAADLDLLDKGVRDFPHQLRLVYHAAQLCADSGFPKRAASLADWGHRLALETADKERFAQLQANLPAVPPGVK
ncbi:MAG: hypothetical protein JWQ83_1280, partial [Lacunisphaera sp.]|nr:hypothetical protein [Lacunisphaera sp.]